MFAALASLRRLTTTQPFRDALAPLLWGATLNGVNNNSALRDTLYFNPFAWSTELTEFERRGASLYASPLGHGIYLIKSRGKTRAGSHPPRQVTICNLVECRNVASPSNFAEALVQLGDFEASRVTSRFHAEKRNKSLGHTASSQKSFSPVLPLLWRGKVSCRLSLSKS